MPTEQELDKAHNTGYDDGNIAVYNNYYEHLKLRKAYDEGWDARCKAVLRSHLQIIEQRKNG